MILNQRDTSGSTLNHSSWFLKLAHKFLSFLAIFAKKLLKLSYSDRSKKKNIRYVFLLLFFQ